MEYDFSVKACYDSVKMYVETMHRNVFEMLGRMIIRAEQDVFFNKNMIIACKQYIKDNNLEWDDKI